MYLKLRATYKLLQILQRLETLDSWQGASRGGVKLTRKASETRLAAPGEELSLLAGLNLRTFDQQPTYEPQQQRRRQEVQVQHAFSDKRLCTWNMSQIKKHFVVGIALALYARDVFKCDRLMSIDLLACKRTPAGQNSGTSGDADITSAIVSVVKYTIIKKIKEALEVSWRSFETMPTTKMSINRPTFESPRIKLHILQIMNYGINVFYTNGGRVTQLVEQFATDWKVRGSIPDGDRIFSRCQTSRTAPRFTQPPTKLSTGSFPGVKGGQSVVPTTPPHSNAEVMESMGHYLHAPQVPS
ncbi:hypothetical protein ANN_03999 [Periplaneta americana]|uniref:Uncharacterized protein n=1 Tax=Periplaneta americana TaxID=6978 RepID=A0ABQ8T8X1_PERAM|nr:hypothetical protein ANN_03999 [Periplaneta americana]